MKVNEENRTQQKTDNQPQPKKRKRYTKRSKVTFTNFEYFVYYTFALWPLASSIPVYIAFIFKLNCLDLLAGICACGYIVLWALVIWLNERKYGGNDMDKK